MSDVKTKLIGKIKDRSAIVGVVGLGDVGLPCAVEKARVGFKVIGVEQNPLRAKKVNRGENYIRDVRDEELRGLVARGMIRAEVDFERVSAMDVIVICVPTPSPRTSPRTSSTWSGLPAKSPNGCGRGSL